MLTFINLIYFIVAILFILGLKQMSSPVTARKGIVWAGIGMFLATIVTFIHPDGQKDFANYFLVNIVAIGIGGSIAWITGKKVAMTDMPQMIALYNGMGGGAAAAISAVILIQQEHADNLIIQSIATLGALIGSMAFSGSLVAYAKLQGIMKKSYRFANQQIINGITFLIVILLAINIATAGHGYSMSGLLVFFVLALAFGVMSTTPIGGADMPVVISLYNAFTGLAVGFEGYVLGIPAMMIAGIVVGSAGTLLTQLMAKAMNRPISNVLFGNFGEGGGEAQEVTGSMKEIEASDAAIQMAFANKVIIIPGYGMAVAQAQHKIWEMTKLLQDRGVEVKFAIHPVAGRMPGHMNVLLAEAGVPYDIIADLDEINEEFETTDVALVIGANDVVNPAARTDKNSPIYGMPILNADKAANVIVMKRGKGKGFSGIENHLFFKDNTRMLYGDAQATANKLVATIKEL